ncbi:MAG: bacterial transcriptional activator domain-containing protein [Lachnospiraceae bacterium]
MEHKIKAQMLGNFSMEYDGKPLASERMHRDGQFTRMMQVILHFSETGISKEKLEEYVVGERDMGNPHTAIRVIVYKTKKKLEQLGLWGENWIYQKDGMYYWTSDITVIEDAKEFEKKYKKAQAYQTRLPVEEQKDASETLLKLYMDALELYKGDFLSGYTAETWVAQEARHYQQMFRACVETIAELLREHKDWKAMETLGMRAAQIEPYQNWEVLKMESLVKAGRYDEATEYYSEVADDYLEEYGIYPSTKMLHLLDYHATEMIHTDGILENIQEKMCEEQERPVGGFCCSYPVFRGLYQWACRRMDRTQHVVYLMLCSLVDEQGKILSDEKAREKQMEMLRNSIGTSIRQCDAFMQYSRCQYLVLLILKEEKDGVLVENRINHSFMQKQKNEKKKYHVNCLFTEI